MPNFRPFEWCKVFRIRKQLKVRTCWKCNKNEHRFSYERYFTERAIFEKPHSSFSDGEKHEIITRRNILLKQVKIIQIIFLILLKKMRQKQLRTILVIHCVSKKFLINQNFLEFSFFVRQKYSYNFCSLCEITFKTYR